MFHVEAMIRPQGTKMAYYKKSWHSDGSDASLHMATLEEKGYEVLSVKSWAVDDDPPEDRFDRQGNMGAVNGVTVESEVIDHDEEGLHSAGSSDEEDTGVV